ncbi:MAG: hypothetical protein A3K68_04695 [Euryarchaeota archaeon RBG_16_68_13]|nr:MAG: hypothetical protein A3K68_04695 [Euryarchaeota archaeon RBG_16_68_13]
MQAAGSTAAGVPSGQDAIPRRVIRKPIGGQPLVQKKVIRRPAEGESTESQVQSQASENPEDEL